MQDGPRANVLKKHSQWGQYGSKILMAFLSRVDPDGEGKGALDTPGNAQVAIDFQIIQMLLERSSYDPL